MIRLLVRAYLETVGLFFTILIALGMLSKKDDQTEETE